MAERYEFKPVDQANWADYEALFSAKGAPGYCWCMANRMTKEELKHNNRDCRKVFIKQRVDAAVPIGLLAYCEGKAVAWCSVAPRETFQNLGGDETLERVWAITCFFIQKDHRHEGLARRLVEAAVAYAKTGGAAYIEAYPVDSDSPSYRHMGFVPMFEKLGFSFVKMSGSRRHVMVRKI